MKKKGDAAKSIAEKTDLGNKDASAKDK